ncbi:MAG: hypothetical protein AB7S97_03590 [Thermoplasmata archaeon]
MKCPQCGRRVGFNERGTNCPRCGAWLLSRPPSEHALERMRRDGEKDGFLNDFPWIGGAPGRRAVAFTAAWVIVLVALAVSILLAFVTMHFILAFVLIFLTALVGVLPVFFLVGSRI